MSDTTITPLVIPESTYVDTDPLPEYPTGLPVPTIDLNFNTEGNRLEVVFEFPSGGSITAWRDHMGDFTDSVEVSWGDLTYSSETGAEVSEGDTEALTEWMRAVHDRIDTVVFAVLHENIANNSTVVDAIVATARVFPDAEEHDHEARVAASNAVAALIPGATTQDDGGGPYVALPTAEGTEPPIVYILPPGEGDKAGRWHFFHDTTGRLVVSDLTVETPPADVVAWANAEAGS